MSGGNDFTPGYAVYENGQPTRIVLMSFVDDGTGASDYIASIPIGPSQVQDCLFSTRN